MNFEDLKNSYFSKIYEIKNDIVFVFDNKELGLDLKALSQEVKNHMSSGFVFQTSGTSRDKKFVFHDFESLKISAQSVSNHMGWSKEDLFVCPLSIFHMGGFSVLFRAFILEASRPLVVPWDSKSILLILDEVLKNPSGTSSKEIDSDRAIHLSLVPQQIYDIVQNKISCHSRIRSVLVGGSALNFDLHRRALDLGWPLYKTFGSTEAGSQIFTQKEPGLEKEMELLSHWEGVFTSKLKVLNLKGSSLFKAYLKCKEGYFWETFPPSLNPQGFFETEDCVELSCKIHKPLSSEDCILKETYSRTKESQSVHSLTSKSLESCQLILSTFLGRKDDFIKVDSYLFNIDEVRNEFSEFLENYSMKSMFCISPLEDLKSGYHLTLISEGLSLGHSVFKAADGEQSSEGFDEKAFTLYDIVLLWNKNQKSYKTIRGIYYLQSIPQGPLGKIQYSKIKEYIC